MICRKEAGMKDAIRRVLTAVLIMLAAVLMLTGCRPAQTPEDAQAYVQAVLDIMCTGDYDHSVRLAGIEEGKESEMRDGLIDDMIASLSSEEDLSDEVSAAFRDMMVKALENTRYTVGEAAPADDGGFDVTVSIEPLRIYAGVSEKLEAELEKRISDDPDTLLSMTEEEQNEYIMKILLDILSANLDDPQYDPAEEVIVHYGPLEGENDAFGCAESEGERLGEKLFSDEGL